MELQAHYMQLVDLINKYRKAYFEDNESLIPDEEYDKLFKELLHMEKENPELVTPDSPTSKVGYTTSRDKLKHPHPMLSLDNVFTLDELKGFMNRCHKKQDVTEFYLDSKIDGLALDLIYRKGVLTAAITRGNGEYGEDVLVNAETIVNIPKNINCESTISIRGEVSAHRETFNQINDRLEREGKPTFSHIRNYAAGSLRQNDPEVTRSRHLKFYAWECLSNPLLDKDQQMAILVKLGFNIPDGKLCKSVAEMEEYIHRQGMGKTEFSYPIDGVVIKVNSALACSNLGTNSRSPLWAVAWKFTDKGSNTTVVDVHWQVGRTGKLTPVASLSPVAVDGATISEVTLHNADYYLRKNIGTGAEVTIVRRGDVIPKIDKIISHGDVKGLPTICPSCGETLHLVKGVSSQDLRCINKKCPGMFKAFLVYLTGKDVFNVKGIGPSIINEFMASNVNEFLDIFKPIVMNGKNQQILADKLVTRARKITMVELFMVIGIPGMGKAIASKLSTETRDLAGLTRILDNKSERNQLRLSPSVKDNLTKWWDNPTNREFIDSLRSLDLPNL